jgi:hypothetical protein
VNECRNNPDPDCPPFPDGQSKATPYPSAVVDTKCGGKLGVFASDSSFGLAASRVAARYPSFNVAQKAENPSFFDAHPSGIVATSHGELKGFGVTMIQGEFPKNVENASGDLADPTLLFFEKTGKDQDDWKLIGMGYSFKFDTDNERPPTEIAGVDPGIWWIHEAGYHHSPGDGGFTCASNDDLKRSVFDAGKRVDQAGCFAIDKDDLKTREFNVNRKHGRYWALHIWFEPKTLRPTISKTDPWCRQGDDAVLVPSCAFFKQDQC